MKCKHCENQKMTSIVDLPTIVKTKSDKVIQFYDEEGGYHYHDPSVYIKIFKCSNGHETQIEDFHGCPTCGNKWRHGI